MRPRPCPKAPLRRANAKSLRGGWICLTRTITDGGTEFDRIAPGYNRPAVRRDLPALVSVLVRPGMRLNQITVFNRECALDDATPAVRYMADTPLVDGEAVIDAWFWAFPSIWRLPAIRPLVGYRRPSRISVLIDSDKLGYYQAANTGKRSTSDNGQIILIPGRFYNSW